MKMYAGMYVVVYHPGQDSETVIDIYRKYGDALEYCRENEWREIDIMKVNADGTLTTEF